MDYPYYQYKDYMVETYGFVLHRIPIDLGFTCSNRNADKSGGCTFCSETGNRAVQTINQKTIEKQISSAIQFSRKRYGAKSFMAYFQTFSASFEDEIQKKYQEILNKYKFNAITFGTRPDCINNEVIVFLKELNKTIPVWIELGIQTTHDKTLKRINRGHNWQLSKEMILLLKKNGIKVAGHVIIGLPGETQSDFNNTAKELNNLAIDGIKIHNLHIASNTKLAEEFQHNPFHVYTEHEYADYLIDFLRYLSPTIPIMRLSTDTEKTNLLAPIWHINKNQFKDYVVNKMICQEIRQGDKIKKIIITKTPFKTIKTKDQSLTFWNNEFKEHYHSIFGARIESEEKFVIPSKLSEKLMQKDIKILDVCFGLGYNSLSALNLGCKSKNKLFITALEMDKRVVQNSSEVILEKPTDLFSWRSCLSKIYSKGYFEHQNAFLSVFWNDARYSIQKLKEREFDIVFLDAFSSQRNSELWTEDFFKQIKRVMSPSGILLTYSSAIPVLSGFIKNGFHIGKTLPLTLEKNGTIASMKIEDIINPLSDKELEQLNTTRGISYRDPYGILTNNDILRNREIEIIQRKKELIKI